jgi:L-ornithine N5-monooxygenase
LYNQRLEDTISKRPDADPVDIDRTSRIAILPYSSVVRAEVLLNSDSNTDSFLLTIQDVLSCRITYKTYDAVICATGYDRTSWSKVLTQSDLGKHFIHNTEAARGPIQLVPSQYDQVIEIEDQGYIPGNLAAISRTTSLSGSCISSSPTSSGSLSPLPTQTEGANREIMYVSRAYRLLPVAGEGEHLPRIYLQGCTEMTHGISDTLLSVVGVRAGEIVVDLLQGICDES